MVKLTGPADDGRPAPAPALQSFWADHAGLSAARLQILSGDRILAVWLDEVLNSLHSAL